MHEAELKFRRARKLKTGSQEYRTLQVNFRLTQKIFDKTLRRKKQSYHSKLSMKLDECNTKNSTEF